MSASIKYAGIMLTVAVAGLAAFLALRPHRNHPLQVGDAAPNFTVARFVSPAGRPDEPSGKTDPQVAIRLSDYRHRVVLVNFWAAWCPPCVEEAPSLENFAEQTQPLGVTVIGVSVDQDTTLLQKFLDQHPTSFVIGRDPEQALAGRYGTSKFPETYILDRDGRLAEKIIGAIDWQDPRMLTYVRALAGVTERVSR
jgi:cytochrome c biogenesis protein CcmG/thiol:disulfide interchange protein DsbE